MAMECVVARRHPIKAGLAHTIRMERANLKGRGAVKRWPVNDYCALVNAL
jgi:hypothetical protein